MDFVNRFEDALSKGCIKTYFQPLTRTISGKVCGAEALARWEDPQRGLIPPGEFIGLLEEYRLIHKLDLAMLKNVCRFYQQNDCKDMTFSINLSRIDFVETDMLREITKILSEYDVPVNTIHLEITESTMLRNREKTRRLFKQFNDAGFSVWLDDFGSGYSSLNVLKDYRFDVLKIDMSLLQQFDVCSRKIIYSIINMAKALGIHTLSEGVETEEQLAYLRSIGCEIVQGYYYSKPLCEADFLGYLAQHPSESASERDFWNDAGKVNFLSGDPLMTSSDAANSDEMLSTAPLALIEYNNGVITYPYVNTAYIKEISKLGYNSAKQIEHDVNDEQYEYRDRFMMQIKMTIHRGGVQKMNNIMNEVVYTFSTKLVASAGDRHLIAATVHVIESERSDYLILKYSQSLYATYNLVTEITPDKDIAVQIYSNAGFAKVYGKISLRKGILEFADHEVHPDDRDRYLTFFDLETLNERVTHFIQQSFRVRSGEDYALKIIRISKLKNGKYLYTIQSC
ncbi:signal peptide protein [Ruminococcus albus SY3]|uniref:Signal peptide protein n=1 Tax=Ruminococcus albus SY3 TaxID=1341156 RepID=A0A011VQT3_RUMAL|nr:EAL domain-containing protein [Ruminococcus albus]EXM37611.1 signal peptide protein [Ruminococcus albus SY3]